MATEKKTGETPKKKGREGAVLPQSRFKELATTWLRFGGVFIVLIIALSAIITAHYARIMQDWLSETPYLHELASGPIIIERQFHDKRSVFLHKDNPLDKDIVMLMIDDISLQRVGRWPWSRLIWANVLDRLAHYDAKVVAFDIMFPEPEEACSGPSPDKEFARAIERFQEGGKRSVVLAYTLTNDPAEAIGEYPVELYYSLVTGKPTGMVTSIKNYIRKSTFPINEILASGPLLGNIDIMPSADGVYRDYALLGVFDSNIFPSLALASFNHYFKKTDDDQILYEEDPQNFRASLGIVQTDEEPWTLPLNARGEVRVRWHGDETKFKQVSLHAFLDASLDDETMQATFKDKMIFIGSSAVGAHDLRVSPVNPVLPGVYAHSNVFHMLANRLSYRDQDSSFIWSLLLLVGGAAILLAFMQASSPLVHVLGLTVSLVSVYTVDRVHLLPNGYTTSLFFIMTGIFLSYSWVTILDFINMARERKKVREAFTRYVAPEIVKEMLSRPELLRVGGVKKEVSMIFSDIRDFTSMSEKLNPQDLANLLNKYMGKMTDILFESRGTLDKYIGDAIVGFWNAPLDVEQHPYQAVKGALQMVEALPAINRTFRELRYPQISIGIGINTGEVSVGNMGSDRIFSYTALGDHMNLASRLEGLTKYYGAKLLISEFTYDAIPKDKVSEFHFRQVDLVRVKGRRAAVKIFEVLEENHDYRVNPDAMTDYIEGYQLYLNRDFEEAYSKFNALSKRFPEDKATLRLKSSCVNFISDPPEDDWDGVTTFDTK